MNVSLLDAAECFRQLRNSSCKLDLLPYEGMHIEVQRTMRRCHLHHRSLFWIMHFTASTALGQEGKQMFTNPTIGEWHLMCVPPACSADVVGRWLLPSLAFSSHAALSDADTGPRSTSTAGDSGRRLLCRPRRYGRGSKFSTVVSLDPVPAFANVKSLGEVEIGNIYKTSGDGRQKQAFSVFHVLRQRLPRLPKISYEVSGTEPLLAGPPATSREEAAGSPQQRRSSASTAIIFAGSWRLSSRAAAGIRAHLVEPLRALVFAALSDAPAESDDRPDDASAARATFAAAFGEANLAAFLWVQDLEPEELARALRGPAGNFELYMALGGNALSPFSGHGAVLHFLRKLQLAFELVQNFELRERGGERFRWIVSSRTDLLWMAHHPPLGLLRDDAIWIPRTMRRHDSDSNHGVCDRHAAVPRRLASLYFARWQMLVDGNAPATPNMNPERFLQNVLKVFGIRVARFPAVAGLEACARWYCFAGGRWIPEPKDAWRWQSERHEVMRVAVGLQSGQLRWSPLRRQRGAVIDLDVIRVSNGTSILAG